jgi:flavin reductase (DIM6/NTAB) family NADH-FMN oxidoreductase RutF
MDAQAKKFALRMIPYGLYVLTGESSDGRVAASTVNWVTQASFTPPLVAVAVKVDSTAHEVIKGSHAFALNVLGKGQQALAFAFFKTLERAGNSIGGESFSSGKSGSPILASAAAFIECALVGTLEKGDHSIFLGEVIDAGVFRQGSGRPDADTLLLGELGATTFYGG